MRLIKEVDDRVRPITLGSSFKNNTSATSVTVVATLTPLKEEGLIDRDHEGKMRLSLPAQTQTRRIEEGGRQK